MSRGGHRSPLRFLARARVWWPKGVVCAAATAFRPKRSATPSALSVCSGPHTGHFPCSVAEGQLSNLGNTHFRPQAATCSFWPSSICLTTCCCHWIKHERSIRRLVRLIDCGYGHFLDSAFACQSVGGYKSSHQYQLLRGHLCPYKCS